MNKNDPFWKRGAGEAGYFHIRLWEKIHRALRKEKPPSCLPPIACWNGRQDSHVHSSLFITTILGKRNIGGVCHPLCAFHILGLSLQMTQAYALTWHHILSDSVVLYLEVSEFFPKAISKTLVSVWETNVTQGQWLLLWDHDLWLLMCLFLLSSVLFSVVVNVIEILSSTWGYF